MQMEQQNVNWDSNKDNYKLSEQFDNKYTYKCSYKATECNLCAAWSRKTHRCTVHA